jgi:hypothetical protein
MIRPRCDLCGRELVAPGALVFGVPTDADMVRKYHICTRCFHHRIMPLFQRKRPGKQRRAATK